MAGKSNTSATFFAQKKLLGKAHTSNLKVDGEEVIGSNIQSSTGLLFGESIPSSPTRTLYLTQSAPGADATVEYIEFVLNVLTGTTYDANDTGGGSGTDSGESGQSSGPHAYKFVLPSDYESNSDNTRAGNGVFDNGKLVHETLGALQLVPPFFSQAAPNPYIVKIYEDNGGSVGDEIPLLDNIDWNVDYYNGILFLQDYDASKIPAYARAFAYIGKMADELITSASNSGGSGGGSGDASAEYVVAAATGSLPNAKLIEAGSGITITTGSNSITVSSTLNSINGRSKTTYFVTGTHAAFQPLVISGIDFSTADYDQNKIDISFNGQLLHTGSLTQVQNEQRDYFLDTTGSIIFSTNLLEDDVIDAVISVVGTGGGSGGGDSTASYLVLSNTGSLSNERALVAGTGLLANDAGANSDYTLSVDDSVVATLSSSAIFSNGISGSLTNLADGSSYLIAGDNITIVSASNGAVTINSTVSIPTREKATYDVSSPVSSGSAFTTNNSTYSDAGHRASAIDVFINGQLLLSGTDAQVGLGQADYFVFSDTQLKFGFDVNTDDVVSVVLTPTGSSGSGGSGGSGTTYTAGTGLNLTGNEFSVDDSIFASLSGSVFSGHVGVTGSIHATAEVSGSIIKGPVLSGSLTTLENGESYLVAGSNVTITSASNGQVTIASADTNTEYTAGTGLLLDGTQFNVNDSVVATLTSSVVFSNGISGSLTHLSDGSSYLVAGDNITITTASVGSIYISSVDNNTTYTAGDGLSLVGTEFSVASSLAGAGLTESSGVLAVANGTNGGLFVDANSVSLNLANLAEAAVNVASDSIAFIDADGFTTRRETIADLVEATAGTGLNASSGVLSVNDSIVATLTSSAKFSNGLSGSLTQLTDGSSYLIAGSNVTISSASNGAVTISATDNNTTYTAGTGLDLSSTEFSIDDSIVATLSGSQFSGNVGITGSLGIESQTIFNAGIHEKFSTKTSATGVVVHDCSSGHIFYHTSLSADFTANFTNLNLSTTYGTNITLVLVQGATARIPTAVQIGGAAQTLLWQGGSAPSGTNNGTDVVSFSILNNAGTYTVLGQLVGFS